ncbi:MAG: DNA translocase FtsK 4TM domain-containing protein, partial [Terriglobia bacterium]
MNLLTPGKNKRLNELIGFLWLVVGVLLTLALVSYNPLDPSLNVAVPSPEALGEPLARNWVGVVGAYVADLLLQALGYAVVLLPLVSFLLAWNWFRQRPLASPKAKIAGALLLLFSLSTLLGLLPDLPRIHELIPGSGLLGILLAAGLVYGVNVPGAYILSFTGLVVGAYLATRFSFGSSYAWLGEHVGWAQRFAGRWHAWRERRAQRAAAALARPRVVPKAVAISAPADLAAEAAATQQPASAETGTGTVAAFPGEEAGEEGTEPGKSAARAKPVRVVKRARYRMPASSLLRAPEHLGGPNEEELTERAELLTQKFEEFDVQGQVVQINPGPVVTTFEFRPEAGVKLSRITALDDDLCLALKAESILIERIPGKSTVGIEVPNIHRETIVLREIIESQQFAASTHKLTISLGKDLHGNVQVANLGQMPHLLIAGSTGSGKSVAINSMIISMLYKAMPEEVNFILIDPKRLELGLYEGIPHLFTPIVTDPKLAANALRNVTREMEKRLKLLAASGAGLIVEALWREDGVYDLIVVLG